MNQLPIILASIFRTIRDLEMNHTCPECGSDLDSGMGFGRRDLECTSDLDPDCFFSFSYPAEIYFTI